MLNPIKRIRTENEMTQKELSVLANVSMSYIARVELGDYQPNNKILAVAKEIGYSRTKVLSDFEKFRRETEKEIKEKFQRKLDLQFS